MKVKEYTRFTRTTAKYKQQPVRPEIQGLLYLGLALAGEVGEVANEIKKVFRENKTIEEAKPKIVEELGDSIWYMVRLVDELGYTLEEVMSLNKAKLEKRQLNDS